MLTDAEQALDDLVGAASVLQHANGLGRIFELYFLLRIARKLQTQGVDVWLQRSDETVVGPTDLDRTFIQRGGKPSGVASKSLGPDNETAVLFQKSHGELWEIWNGVQFRGRSDGLHELDIAIVPHSVGVMARTGLDGGIPTGRPRVAIECKDVGTDGSIDETRALIARLYDLTHLDVHWHPHLPKRNLHPGAPPTKVHAAPATFKDENNGCFNAIARRTGFVDGTKNLAPYYGIKRYGYLTAGGTNADDFVADVVDWIMKNLP